MNEYLEVLSYFAVFFLGVYLRGLACKPPRKNGRYGDRDGKVIIDM